jgi:lysyl-tRNA synthetase class 1
VVQMHWFDELLGKAEEFLRGRERVLCNAGLSVSGLQHVGRLRGEIALNHAIVRGLRLKGKKASQNLVLYTQDQWKGKEGQLGRFKGREGDQYVGQRLIDVPDPEGCHKNWVDHYWVDFGDYLDSFAPGVSVISTTEIYSRQDMKDLVLELVAKKDAVRDVVNKYRSRKPYPPEWIPFEAYCEKCHRVGNAKTLELLPDYRVRYECECDNSGDTPIEKGKLNWRLEWPALWKVLRVDVEPFGKDHAAPGGSRDSCKEIARKIMGMEAPFPIPYEWVGLGKGGKDLGDMGSSDFIGFTPKQWLEIGDPEVIRYIYFFNPVSRRVVLDLSKVDSYHDLFDSAERAYHSVKRNEEEDVAARSFELALVGKTMEDLPFQLSYRHAAYLSQISPSEHKVSWCIQRLRDTGMLSIPLTPFEEGRIERRLKNAMKWVELYSPENKVTLLQEMTPKVIEQLEEKDREALSMYLRTATTTEWREDAIKESMISLTKGGRLPIETPRFFRDLYLVLLGQERGPRAAPFLAVLKKEWVLERLKESARA